MFKFIMKDSYFKIMVKEDDEQLRLEAKEIIGNQKGSLKSNTVVKINRRVLNLFSAEKTRTTFLKQERSLTTA